MGYKRSEKNPKGHSSAQFQRPVRVPIHADLEQAAALFTGKHKIVILAGQGARGAATELTQVAERLAAPVIKALLGKDVLPDDSPYTTGTIGLLGTRPSSEAIEGCDALLLIGTSFPYLEYLPKPDQAVAVQIDDDPARIGLRYPVTVGLAGDAVATLRELLPLLPQNTDRAFLEQAQAGMRAWNRLMEERGSRPDVPMKPQVVAWELGKLLADDAIITSDSGTISTWGGAANSDPRQPTLFAQWQSGNDGERLSLCYRRASSLPRPPMRGLCRRRRL